jgi:hypothetical protein
MKKTLGVSRRYNMRLIRVIIVLALVLSVVGNIFLFMRTEKLRTQIVVNGQKVTKKEYHDWLEQHYGEETTAKMVHRKLIMQAAEKANMLPTKAEVDEIMADIKEQRPREAALMKIQPWKETDLRESIELQLALQNLTGKEVTVTDEDIKNHYERTAAQWDKPTKIRTHTVVCQDPTTAARAEQLLVQLPPDQRWKNLSVLCEQLRPKAGLFAGDGKWTILKPFSGPANPLVNELAAMKPGDMKKFPQTEGNRTVWMIAVVEKVEPGRKVTLEEVKPKVVRAYKQTRATRAQEYLRTLWDAADVQTDPEGLKASVERMILPERAIQELQASEAGP